MTDIVSPVDPLAAGLANSFQRCSETFKKLYLAIFDYGFISIERLNDEYGRFGVWGGDSGADRTGRGSLDDVLRNDLVTRSIIAEVLENLDEDLNNCIALVKASTNPQEEQSHKGQEWLSDEESSVSSGSELEDSQTGSRGPSTTQRILHLLAIIVDHIQSLFQVSALLRRPTISGKYLRSASKRSTVETESPFLPWDLAHVVEKRRFWINQQRWHSLLHVAKSDDLPPEPTNYLCERLAAANVRRREQLDFWQTHPAEPSVVKLPDQPIRPKPSPLSDPIPSKQPPKKVFPRSEISKQSQGTKHSFSTVARSDLNDSATFSGRPRTEYVPSNHGGKYVLRVPPLPKLLEEAPSFKCPYCSTTLDAKVMSMRELWKKHVFRDLRPYICTFERCENPEKLYLTRHDWIYHEAQMHRRQWICASCSHETFSSKNDMSSHLLAQHSGDFPESQLEIMVAICERPMEDEEDADCPICLATFDLSSLKVHLATHLEELALFALPCYMEDHSQVVDSDKVEGATGKPLASDTSNSEDWLPALDFEKSLPEVPHMQDPTTFSTILHSRLELEHKHMDNWLQIEHQVETPNDSESTRAVAEESNESFQSTANSEFDKIVFGKFPQKVIEARQLQRIIEGITAILVPHPRPKSAVTVGGILQELESLGWDAMPEHESFWDTLSKIIIELERCTESMRLIIEGTKLCVRRPTPEALGNVSIWALHDEISFKTFATELEKSSEAMHTAAVHIQEDMKILYDLSGPGP